MKLPLLLYHDIRPDNFDLSTVEVELRPYILPKPDFIGQMEWLYKNGYRVIGLKELVGEISDKTVLLAFDDGWRSNYEIVYSVLKQYGFKASFFITIENIGKPDMMSWQQLRELQARGMTIGSHNMTHRVPVELSDEELSYELSESKRVLEERLEQKVDFFSSPTGFFDKRLEKFAREDGYKAVCFSKVGFNCFGAGINGFIRLNKIGIKRGYSLGMFRGIVEGKKGVIVPLRIRQWARDCAKRLLGPGRYDRMRERLLRRSLFSPSP